MATLLPSTNSYLLSNIPSVSMLPSEKNKASSLTLTLHLIWKCVQYSWNCTSPIHGMLSHVILLILPGPTLNSCGPQGPFPKNHMSWSPQFSPFIYWQSLTILHLLYFNFHVNLHFQISTVFSQFKIQFYEFSGWECTICAFKLLLLKHLPQAWLLVLSL